MKKANFVNLKIGIIGAGVMGNIFIERLLLSKIVDKNQIIINSRSPVELQKVKKLHGVKISIDKKVLVSESNILILAVKPQDFQELARELRGAGIKKSQLIISIMAGVDIKTIQKALVIKKVARVMPNLPAKIGQGVTVWTMSTQVSREQRNQARKILQTLGVEIEVKQEKTIDLATAVSGSGPAYVFLFQELLQEAGASLGLSSKLSRQLTAQTFWGAINLQRELGIDSKILREQVTSKGGTTAAALQAFGEHQLSEIFIKALKAAFRRGLELKKTL